ncbi:hypothetical protein CBR_g52361 [Chara braunii]|uniref:Reverse transcriptase n=1 Tax=Chara braunii TaxID=69332 RepID=A0A388K6T9_CHABU|nr:hypothetical protein CBR_g52361 [Chara braunii]|eukprot:GBG65770.1 hypothetical protein CBR_g52361 [Chara braunii]
MASPVGSGAGTPCGRRQSDDTQSPGTPTERTDWQVWAEQRQQLRQVRAEAITKGVGRLYVDDNDDGGDMPVEGDNDCNDAEPEDDYPLEELPEIRPMGRKGMGGRGGGRKGSAHRGRRDRSVYKEMDAMAKGNHTNYLKNVEDTETPSGVHMPVRPATESIGHIDVDHCFPTFAAKRSSWLQGVVNKRRSLQGRRLRMSALLAAFGSFADVDHSRPTTVNDSARGAFLPLSNPRNSTCSFPPAVNSFGARADHLSSRVIACPQRTYTFAQLTTFRIPGGFPFAIALPSSAQHSQRVVQPPENDMSTRGSARGRKRDAIPEDTEGQERRRLHIPEAKRGRQEGASDSGGAVGMDGRVRPLQVEDDDDFMTEEDEVADEAWTRGREEAMIDIHITDEAQMGNIPTSGRVQGGRASGSTTRAATIEAPTPSRQPATPTIQRQRYASEGGDVHPPVHAGGAEVVAASGAATWCRAEIVAAAGAATLRRGEVIATGGTGTSHGGGGGGGVREDGDGQRDAGHARNRNEREDNEPLVKQFLQTVDEIHNTAADWVRCSVYLVGTARLKETLSSRAIEISRVFLNQILMRVSERADNLCEMFVAMENRMRSVPQDEQELVADKKYILGCSSELNSMQRSIDDCKKCLDFLGANSRKEGSTATSAGTLDAAPVRQQGETMTAFLARLGTCMQQVQEEQQREAAAEEARLNAIAHAEEQRCRQQVDAAANHNKARQDAASVLMQQEAAHIAALQAWNVDPAAVTEPTTEEQTKSALANMMYQVILTCNWQQVELARQARTITEYEETLKSLHARLDMLEKDDVPHRHTASSSIDPPIRELEERLDHLVALVGNLNSFRQPTTISQQISALQADLRQLRQQPTGTCNNVTPKQFKMSKFSIERFDDYHKADPISWWQGFTNEFSIHLVPPKSKISALYLCSTGASQVWLNHLAQTEGVKVSKLHTKITWEAMTEKWQKRFIVDDAQGQGVNRIFSMHQGSQPTCEWLTEWQKIATIPKAGSQQVAAVQGNGQENDQAMTHEQRRCLFTAKLGKLSSVGSEATPLPTPPGMVALQTTSSTSGEHAYVASLHEDYEDYVVQLVPPLDQPLHVQESFACATSSPSPSEPASSPTSLRDVSVWSRLEELNPLTPEDFQWLPLPPSCSLPKPHCNALMAELRNYLHAAVPTPLMEDGVAVVDLREYIAKIDCEYATQRYDDTDAPLLYIRIQIGKATCSALIDCGATRNYISEDFMTRAGLGPCVRRKSQPTQVTLADGRTHKSIDRCIDSVPMYFAPLAREAVSFDILDTKFDMILGMSWLRSEDHPVNFYHRAVHVRDRNGVLVPCTVPPSHPSIGCHVVSAASIRNSIARNDVEEMGICFLHTLPPPDEPAAEQPPDPHIVQLLDSYGDVFETPAGIVPNRPIRHEIILEDWVVPPRGCIYRMSEEELEVLRTQLYDLIDKGWICPSCSPYGAPVFFVRKKNKELCLCIDYRKLNAQTIKNTGPLPRIDDLLERLGGAKYFSKLDLKSGYHQLEIHPRDRHKTVFKTRYGHFEWVIMPFGLTNAPTTFQAAMPTEFRDMLDRFVLIYLDDILVYSQTLDEHIVHLRAVLDRLRTTKYKANGAKCEFAQQELEYLGHFVTPQGISPLADKIKFWNNTTEEIGIRLRTSAKRFTWVKDNNPLTYYKTQDTVSNTIARWMYFIDQFDFTPKHIPGLSNRAADAFSRRSDLCAVTHHAFSFDEALHQHSVRAYKSDPEYATLYTQLSSDHPPASHYRVVDGCLLLHARGKDLLCVPHDRRLRTRLLGEYHDSRLTGHLGVNRTIARLRQRFWWPDLITDVTRYCDSCEVCRQSNPHNRNPYGELCLSPIPREPGLSIAMDVTGPFPRDRFGHDDILTVVDRLSKYARFLPCKYHATAPELARLLHTGWICSHGVPEDIVSDRYTQFMSAFWTSLMKESGTEMKPNSARHPQTDGQTERAHQTAQVMLLTLIRTDQKDWMDHLPDIEFAYNTSVHPAIGVTPFELHHGGLKGRIFDDLPFPRTADIDAACSPASVRKYRDLLANARANMQKAQVHMQQQANRRRVPCPIRAGDLVWVSTEEFALEQDVSRKLLPKWFGPWPVTSAAGDEPDGHSFVIEILPHLTVHSIFHASKLATYTPAKSDDFPGRRSQDPPSMDGHQEVDRVITHRKHGNKPMQYKVTFKWCDPDDTR